MAGPGFPGYPQPPPFPFPTSTSTPPHPTPSQNDTPPQPPTLSQNDTPPQPAPSQSHTSTAAPSPSPHSHQYSISSNPTQHATVATPSAQPLVEGNRYYSFKAGSLNTDSSSEAKRTSTDPSSTTEPGVEHSSPGTSVERKAPLFRAESTEEEREGEKDGSPVQVDELRQRRLQRFDSVPSSARDSGALEEAKAAAEKESESTGEH